MKINLKNGTNNDTVYATVRMNQEEYKALRIFMHTADGNNVSFPYGTEIVKQGFGWYRLLATSSNRAIDKVQFALRILRRFMKEQEDKITEEIKYFVPMMLDPSLHVQAFSAAHSAGEYKYGGPSTPKEPNRATPDQLKSLVSAYQMRRA